MITNQRGKIFVTETDGGCISVCDKHQQEVKPYQEGLNHPSAMAINADGDIYVGDRFNYCVKKFKADGSIKTSKDGKSTIAEKFCEPDGIAFNQTNKRVYVADGSKQSIKMFDEDLNPVNGTFGGLGEKRGKFIHPTRVACGNDGKVYVVDSINHRIQIFTAKGEFLKTFGTKGDGDNQFNNPIDIAIGGDELYISDRENHRICVYKSFSKVLDIYYNNPEESFKFDPCGIAFDDDFLYICDNANDSIKLFNVSFKCST